MKWVLTTKYTKLGPLALSTKRLLVHFVTFVYFVVRK